MLRVIPGLPMDGRGERLLAAALADDGGAGHLHLVRTRARQAQLRDLEAGRTGCIFGTTVTTLSDLVRTLAGRRSRPRAELADAQRALLIDEIARDEAAPPLAGVGGLATWLGRLFSRLKQGDVFSVDRAFEKFRSLDRDDAGTSEALRLFGLYQARLVELGLYDQDGLYLEVARDLGTAELPLDRLMSRRKRLVVEGFYQTNVVERAVFERLFPAFEEVIWLVDAPDDALGSEGVHADQVIGGRRLPGDLTWLATQRGEKAGMPAETVMGAPAPSAVKERDWGGPGQAVPAARVELAVASDERTEARFLAERAAALAQADPGASVVIAFPSDRAAAPLMIEAFADIGLPLEVAAWRTLSDCAPARALLDLMDLAARDFPRERVVTALRGARDGVVLGGVRLFAPRVDRVSRRAGIIAGASSWRAKLDRLARSLETQAAAASDEDERAGLERQAAETRDVHTGIAALIDLIPKPSAMHDVGSFVRMARGLLDQFGILGVGQAPSGAMAPEEVEAMATSARTRSALDRELETYARSARLLVRAERPWSAHVAAFGALVGATIVPFSPPVLQGARLVGMRELRGLVTDHLLVGGLTEDAFPGPTQRAPLLDEADAALAGEHGAEARRREADHLLAQALRSPRKSLVLSRPGQRDGCEALPALAIEGLGLMDPTDADAELRVGRALGRSTVGRQAAAALAEAATPPDVMEARLRALVDRGARGVLAGHRLGAERERHDLERLGRFEGVLEPAALPLILETPDAPGAPAVGGGPGRLTVSASRLEAFVKCPQLYFFKRVLRLDPLMEADREVSPLERGSLIHRILYRFHAKAAVARLSPFDWPRAMHEIASSEIEQLPHDGLFAETFRDGLLRDLLTAGPVPRPGLLRAYLDYERARDDGFRPAFFEARFGPPPRGGGSDSVLSPEPIFLFEMEAGDRRLAVSLTGSIDRVDVDDRGDPWLALVLDYKTGSVAGKRREACDGLLLQLPLYAHVLPELLAPHAGGRRVAPIAAAYYQVRGSSDVMIDEPLADEVHRARVTKRRIELLPDGGFDALVAASVRRAKDVVRATLAGRFHPTAITGRQAPCETCDFARVCRGRTEAARISAMPEDVRFPQVVSLVPDSQEDA